MPDPGSPLVSVIVPVRDGEMHLPAALASLDAQDRGDFETVIVDDGSRDRSAAIAEAWVARAPRSRRMTTFAASRGVAAARNAGVALARAPWIAFLDQDDLWRPSKLTRQLETVTLDPGLALVAAVPDLLVETEDPDPSLLLWHACMAGLAERPLTELGTGVLLTQAPICMSSVLVHSEALRGIGGFDTSLRWTSDLDAWVRLSLVGRLTLMADRLVRYRIHGQNDFSQLEAHGGVMAEARRIRERLAQTPSLFGCATPAAARDRIASLSIPAAWRDHASA